MKEFMMQYGIDTLIISLLNLILTGLIKMPVKRLAEKSENSKKITKFITFLPVILGFGLTALLSFAFNARVDFDRRFYTQWLSSVSLSLSVYAFWEKFVPSEKKILSEAEIRENKALVDKLTNNLAENSDKEEKSVAPDAISNVTGHDAKQQEPYKKIILTNKKIKL